MIEETLKLKEISLDEAHIFLYHIGYSIDEIIDITNKVYNLEQSKIPYNKLCVLIKIYNDGWYPNWEDKNQIKWINYFQMQGGFSYWNTYYFVTCTIVPSALCIKSKEYAELIIKNYKELYEEVYK